MSEHRASREGSYLPFERTLAGAFYGANGIPESWQEKLALRDRIAAFAERLLTLRVAGA